MKKLLAGLFIVCFGVKYTAQDTDKSFRFGLKIAPSINWLKPEDTRKYLSDGTSLSFNWGLVTEFRLSDLFHVHTGIELNHEKGKIAFQNPTFYFMNDNYDFIEIDGNDGTIVNGPKEHDTISLASRVYRSTYVTIPLLMKMKTNEVGYMTYFGEFGGNFAFRTKTKVDDNAIDLGGNFNGNLRDFNKILYDDDMQPLRVQLKVGGGVEYNLSGSTSIFAGVHYNLGFTNVLRKTSRYIVNDDYSPIRQKASAHSVDLTIGVLF